LDAQDHQDTQQQTADGDVRRALQRLERRKAAIQADLQRLAQRGSSTIVRTEPDARSMRGLHGAPGYNLQTAVEVASHLIVAHQVTNDVNDQRQLQPMAEAASQALQATCTVVADAGYTNGEQIAQLDAKGIVSYVALNRAVNNQAGGTQYGRDAFSYEPGADRYTCPSGKTLTRKQSSARDKLVIYAARREDCANCSLKPQCTSAARRLVTRHWYEDAFEANARRLAERPEMMALRRQTVEHPFDSIKHRILGNARLLLRGMRGAQTEFSLAVLAYNMKRVFNMKGAAWMHQALQG